MHFLLCVFTGVFQENILGGKLLQQWSHLNAFSSVCVILVSFKNPFCDFFTTLNTSKWLCFQCMISCALQENLFGETFTNLVTFKCTFSYVCLLVYFKKTFLGKNFCNTDHIYMQFLQCVFSGVFQENLFGKTFSTLITFIWLFSGVGFLVSFKRTLWDKLLPQWLMFFR